MNFYNLIANLQISMDPSTDRGDNISYSEKVNIANDSPDIPMELIDDLAEMLNERDGNAFFSSQDVEKIKNKYPKIAADLLQVIKNNCKWSGIVKIFADDVPEELKGACQNDVDAIVDALNKIGFKVERDTFNHILPKFMIKEYVKGCIETVNNEEFVSFAKTFMSNFGCIKNWNIYDASKIISIFQNDSTAGVAFREMLLSREFGGFVKFMNDEYGMKVLSETSMGADIFTDPNKLSRWKDPRNINMYRKLNERYHFQNNRRFMNRDIDTIEKIRGFKNIDELLDEVDWMVEAYRKNESNVGIRDAGTVLSFMQSANQPEHRKKFQDFERKEVRKINEFLRENFGFVLSVFNMTERCMKAVLFFSNNPEVLLVLKNYPQRLIRSAITGALAPEEVQVLLPQMNDAWVRKTFFEFDSYAGWDSIEDIIVYSKHPHREEVLEMAKRFGLDFVDSVKNVFTLRDSEDGWEIFLTILEKCPKVSIDFDNSQDATWLISDEAIYFMENGEFQRMYEAIIEGVDLKTIRLDVIIEVLALPEQNKNLVHNKSFIDKAKKFFELADSGDKFGEYEICKYLEIGESGVDILLSDEVQDAILAVKANTSLAIDFLDLDPFLKFIAKGGCQLMIRLAELKLFRKEGFYRFYEFSSLIEACPDILQKLNDEKIGTFLTKAVNEDLIYLRDLKDMGSFLEIGHAPEIIENLKGVKQIIDRSIVKKDLFFLNKLLKDEIKSKILQDEGFIKFCKMTGEKILIPPYVDITDVMPLVDLYIKMSEGGTLDPTLIISNDSLRNMIKIIGDDFNIRLLRAGLLPQLLELADKYHREEVDKLLKQLGRVPCGGDIPLLNHIAQNNDLKKLLFNREALLENASWIYSPHNAPSERLKYTENSLVKDVIEDYTERPPLEDLDNLALLRLVMLERALNSHITQSELGKIIRKDINDKTTEYGGTVLLNESGYAYDNKGALLFEGSGLTFNNIESFSESNGAYANPLNGFISGGAMSFHLHAISEDESVYSGPSGHWTRGPGDWGYIRSYNHTDVVITTMGRSGSQDGGDRGPLRINVDMYYYDSDQNPRVIDLGIYHLPEEK